MILPGLLGQHVFGRRLGAEKDPDEVDFKGLDPFLGGLFQEGFGDGHAGVVDQDVDAAELLHKSVHEALDRLLLGDVSGKGFERIALGLSGLGRFFQVIGVNIDHPHLCPLGEHQHRRGEPDASSSTGDQCDFVFESHLDTFLSREFFYENVSGDRASKLRKDSLCSLLGPSTP